MANGFMGLKEAIKLFDRFLLAWQGVFLWSQNNGWIFRRQALITSNDVAQVKIRVWAWDGNFSLLQLFPIGWFCLMKILMGKIGKMLPSIIQEWLKLLWCAWKNWIFKTTLFDSSQFFPSWGIFRMKIANGIISKMHHSIFEFSITVRVMCLLLP